MEAWKIMEEKKIGLNDISCSFMVQALCRGGYLQEAFDLITFIGENHGFYPKLRVYNDFLRACSKEKNVVHANQCLGLMERRMVGKDEITYVELLKLAVCQKNLSAVHEIWKDYMKHYSPSILPLRVFIQSFISLRDLKSAYKTLQYMVALVIREKIVDAYSDGRLLYSSKFPIPVPANVELGSLEFDLQNEQSVSLEAKDSISRTQECTIFGLKNREAKRGGIVGFYNYRTAPVMRVLRYCFDRVMLGCAEAQQYTLAKQLMQQMEKLGLKPSSVTYDSFVRAALSGGGIFEGLKVLEEMQQKNFKPCDKTLAALSVGCSRALKLDQAEFLLGQMSHHADAYPFNKFFVACDMTDQPELAVQMLGKMRKLGVQPDIKTYEVLVSLFGTCNAPYERGDMLSQVQCAKRIRAIEIDMANNGVQHSHSSMKNLLKALGKEGMIRQLIQYLHATEDIFCRTNTYLGTPIYNTVLHSLVAAGESHLAMELFKHMKSSGFTPNTATYSIMIDCCSITRCYKTACGLLSMMFRAGYLPGIVAYTALIKVMVKCRRFYEALDLFYPVSLECKLDVESCNAILKELRRWEMIDAVEFVAEHMHREKILPDPSTCHYIYSAYVNCGFPSTAMEALQVLSMRMICGRGSTFRKLLEKFQDDFILSEDLEVEERIPELFKSFGGHVSYALLNLRWCAILGSPICRSPDESLWARRLSSNYDGKKENCPVVVGSR